MMPIPREIRVTTIQTSRMMTRVNIDMFAKSPANPAKHPVLSGAVQPFHVHKMGV